LNLKIGCSLRIIGLRAEIRRIGIEIA
jgi:hypothetical protein